MFFDLRIQPNGVSIFPVRGLRQEFQRLHPRDVSAQRMGRITGLDKVGSQNLPIPPNAEGGMRAPRWDVIVESDPAVIRAKLPIQGKGQARRGVSAQGVSVYLALHLYLFPLVTQITACAKCAIAHFNG
jgi:hypothetical protein